MTHIWKILFHFNCNYHIWRIFYTECNKIRIGLQKSIHFFSAILSGALCDIYLPLRHHAVDHVLILLLDNEGLSVQRVILQLWSTLWLVTVEVNETIIQIYKRTNQYNFWRVWNLSEQLTRVVKVGSHMRPNLYIFMMLLLKCLQFMGHISCDGGATGHAVDGAMAVGMDQEAVVAMVLGRGDADVELSQLLARVWDGDEAILKHQVLVIILLWTVNPMSKCNLLCILMKWKSLKWNLPIKFNIRTVLWWSRWVGDLNTST